MTNPRIVVGAGKPNKIAALVCEYSILKYCPEAEIIHTYDVEFCPEGNSSLHRDRWSDEGVEWLPTHRTGTLFSYCRTMVPEICGFEGEAIYLDSDMIVFDNIRGMWDLPMNGAKILRMIDGQYSVLKYECSDMEPWTIGKLLRQGIRYRDILNGRYLPQGYVQKKIPKVWNCLDRWYEGTKLLHYTRMQTQPWARPGHRYGDKWFDLLAEAVVEGFLDVSTLEAEIREQDLGKTWQAAVYPQPHVLKELKDRL